MKVFLAAQGRSRGTICFNRGIGSVPENGTEHGVQGRVRQQNSQVVTGMGVVLDASLSSRQLQLNRVCGGIDQ